MKKKLLFTGGGGVFTETVWDAFKDKYDLFFADIDTKNIFYRIPKLKRLKIKRGNSKDFIKSLKTLDKKFNFNLIIPNVDEEILNIVNSKKKFKNLYLPPYPFCKLSLNKLNFFNYLKQKNIENLDTHSLKNFKNFKKNKQYIIKPIYGRGSRFVEKIKNSKDLKNFLSFYKKKKDDFIIQNFIYGDEYTVFVHYTKNNITIIPVRVFQKKGITIKAKIEKNLRIENFIKKRLIKVLNVKNCFNIQLIVKGKNIYVIEINPRLSTTFALIIKAGYDPFETKPTSQFILNNGLKMNRFITTRYY
jgi:predicted ATP-grasp superfamily ATP-dependent carboligase